MKLAGGWNGMRVRMGAMLVLSMVAGACTKASLTPTAASPRAVEDGVQLARDLRDREALPEAAREMLHGRMERHGDQVIYLVSSVLMLDYPSVIRLADELASEPKLGRPAARDTDTLNALLPPAFFEHQDGLAQHARALADAARAHDDVKLADAFGAVTKHCVGCHSAYLDDDLGFPLHDEPERPGACESDDDRSGDATREAPAHRLFPL